MINGDNVSSVKIAQNPVKLVRNKHIKERSYTHEKLNYVMYQPLKNLPICLLTNALGHLKSTNLRDKLNIITSEEYSSSPITGFSLSALIPSILPKSQLGNLQGIGKTLRSAPRNPDKSLSDALGYLSLSTVLKKLGWCRRTIFRASHSKLASTKLHHLVCHTNRSLRACLHHGP